MTRTKSTYHMRLRGARERIRMRQEDAAPKLGMRRERLGRLERGEAPILAEDMHAAAVLYGCTLGQLYGLEPLEVD